MLPNNNPIPPKHTNEILYLFSYSGVFSIRQRLSLKVEVSVCLWLLMKPTSLWKSIRSVVNSKHWSSFKRYESFALYLYSQGWNAKLFYAWLNNYRWPDSVFAIVSNLYVTIRWWLSVIWDKDKNQHKMLKIQQIFPKLYRCLLYVVFHNLEHQSAWLVDVKRGLH